MMDAEYVPLLTDALRGYFKEEELLDLCRLFDVPVEFEGSNLSHHRLASILVTESEHGNNRRLLEAVVPSLLDRARGGVAKTGWEWKDYHDRMAQRLEGLEAALVRDKVPEEISVPEAKPFRAKSEAREFFAGAENKITLVDNWIGVGTLDCLRDAKHPVRILTGQHAAAIGNGFDRALREFRAEGFTVEVHQHPKLHDRYVLFNNRCWLAGCSFKDAGKKAFNLIEVVDGKASISAEVEQKWSAAALYSI